MASRSSRTERRAFTLTEALIGLGVGLVLLGISCAALTSGSRLRARAESKLSATSDAELLLRALAADLSSAIQPPHAEATTLALTTAEGPVQWTFTAVASGRGSRAERVAPSGTKRYFMDALTEATLTPLAFSGHDAVSLSLSARSAADADPAVFQETFFLRGPHADPEWNPLR